MCWRWRATCASFSSSWQTGCTTCARWNPCRTTSANASPRDHGNLRADLQPPRAERDYRELQDLSFKYLHPNRYAVLSRRLKLRAATAAKCLARCSKRYGNGWGVKYSGGRTGREKNIYSIYKKMQSKSLAFAEVLDIYGFRVLVNDFASCYIALGALHGLYKPIPGKFKDYIAIPK